MTKDDKKQKINFYDLLKDLLIPNKLSLNLYLFNIYYVIFLKLFQELSNRKGISKSSFLSFYQLPGLICERLFSAFNKNNSEFLSVDDFVEGMEDLFSGNYDALIKLIFEFYSFNKDSKIYVDDIRIIHSQLLFISEIRKDKLEK